MDVKEIKNALKSAREAIRNKDYKEALKHCKGILKTDPDNYNALVFVGVAAEGLEQPDQALMAYKKATEVIPENPLAWQGLCSFFEKINKPQYLEDLANVYIHLQKLHSSDSVKKTELGLKLGALYSSGGRLVDAVDVYQSLLRQTLGPRSQVLRLLVSALETLPQPTDPQAQLCLKSYEELVGDGEDVQTDERTWTAYLQLLRKVGSSGDDLEAAAMRCSEAHPDVSLSREILAMIYLDKSPSASLNQASISTHLSELERVSSDSGYTQLLRGMSLLSTGTLGDARDYLKSGLTRNKGCVSGWLYLSQTLCRLHSYTQGFQTASQGLTQLQKVFVYFGDKSDVEQQLLVCQAEAGVMGNSPALLEQAGTILNQLRSDNVSDEKIHILTGRLHMKNNELKNALKEFCGESALAKALRGWCEYRLGHHDTVLKLLNEAVQLVDDSSEIHYLMGQVLYELKSPETTGKCATHFLKAAKLDPFFSPAFHSLGLYYQHIIKDLGKSSRCYQKAYDLDPDNEETGAALIDTLMTTGEQEKAVRVLKSVTSQASAGSAKWAWLRLGLYQMKYGDPTASIVSLQSALRADSKDIHCWECLGEAYMSRGTLNAALRAFNRATELNPGAIFCYYQMAKIRQALGSYTEAAAEYKKILDKEPCYVPALEGLGETLVLLARGALKEFFHRRCVDYCQEAVVTLTKAVSERGDLACVWKLLGDACTILYPVHQSQAILSVPAKLVSHTGGSTEDKLVNLQKEEVLAVGARCYGMALKQTPDCAALWHDLGINYYYQSKMATDKVKVTLWVGKAMRCLQNAARLDSGNHGHWNALGVVSVGPEVDRPGLAQHCFIKSIEAENNNVRAWTNLGVLYLKQGSVKLAHEAFKVAQSLEPSYVSAWIGQALVAESIGDEEAMDLFRHTTELGNHTEGAVGYAHWVCRTLLDSRSKPGPMFRYAIEKMAAIPAASDALAKYTDRVKDNPVAYNLYGLLLERQGLHSEACKAFQSALTLVQKSGDAALVEKIRTNYARALCSAGKASDSVEQYRCLKLATVDQLCGYGLALCGDQQYEESIKTYQTALSVAGDEEKSHIHAALGMVAYKDGDINEAKGALFAGSQLRHVSVPGLQMLLSIGVVESEATLATVVLQELDKLGDLGSEVSSQVDQLAAEACLTDVQRGRNYLLKAVHRHPDRTSLWRHLTKYLLRHRPDSYSAATRCAEKVTSMSKEILPEDITVLAVTGLGAGLHSPREKQSDALQLAKKAVHLYPSKLENWLLLVAAIGAKQQMTNMSLSSNLSLTTYLMGWIETELSQRKDDVTHLTALHLWCVKHYILSLLASGAPDKAQTFLDQAAWLYSDDPHLDLLAAAFKDNFQKLKTLAPSDKSGLGYHLLVSLYLSHGLVQEIENIYHQWLKTMRGRSEKAGILAKLAHLAFHNLLSESSSAASKWSAVFMDACSEALRLDPSCSAVWLMRGLLAMRDKKQARNAKYSLHQVVDQARDGCLPLAGRLATQRLLQAYTEKGDTEMIEQLTKQAQQYTD